MTGQFKARTEAVCRRVHEQGCVTILQLEADGLSPSYARRVLELAPVLDHEVVLGYELPDELGLLTLYNLYLISQGLWKAGARSLCLRSRLEAIKSEAARRYEEMKPKVSPSG